jgi:hypothetical protein
MTVETGTGLADANSYCEVVQADSYHEERGNADWLDETAAKKAAALVRACDYLERAYGRLWKGARSSARQKLSFPRFGIEDLASDEIPRRLTEAQCEAALLEILEPGILKQSPNSGGTILESQEGETTYRFAPGIGSVRHFAAIHGLIACYIGNPSMVKTERS